MSLLLHDKLNDNEAASTVVTDSSGNGYHGICWDNTATVSVEGKIDRAFLFDGQGFTQGDSVLAIAGTLSIAFWTKNDPTRGENYLTFCDAAEVGDIAYGISLNGDATELQAGRIHFYHGDWNTYLDVSTVGQPLNDTNWHHVIVTRSGSDGNNIHIYVDNIEQTLAYAGAKSIIAKNTNSRFNLGDNTGITSTFVGTLDDFRLYDVVIDSAVRAALYNGGDGTESNEFLSFEGWEDYVGGEQYHKKIKKFTPIAVSPEGTQRVDIGLESTLLRALTEIRNLLDDIKTNTIPP